MSNIVPLDNVHHANLRVLTGYGPEFGDAINQAPLFITELAEAQRHHPILFRKNEAGALQALAVLGFEAEENLFLTADRWEGYVPAIIRKGPFFLRQGDGDDPLIVLDLDHPRVRDGGDEGAPLFLEHGGHAPALDAAVAALRQIHVGASSAGRMQELFERLNLVEPISLRVEVSDSKAIDFKSFLAISSDRIAALDGSQLEELNQAGMLLLAVHAASSLGNIPHLIARKQRRDRQIA